MKKNLISKFSTLLVVAFIALLASCVDNEYDTPASREIPVGDVITIAQLKTYFDDSAKVSLNDAVGLAYQFKKDMSVFATVTMDDKSGNIYEQAYIQDVTGGIALKFNVAGGMQVGDTIRFNVKDLVINQYNKAYQINALHGDGFIKENYITKIDVSKPRTPEIATISQINSNKSYYQGRLVKIENVQFVAGDTMQNYADYLNFIARSLTIEDESSNTIIVRTSGFASFADEKTPTGSGSIINVVGQYGSTMQLQIRESNEVVMTSARLGSGTGIDPTGTGTFEDPYNVIKAKQNNTGTDLWVQGYIVGVYETVDAGGNPLATFAPSFTAPFNTNQNFIIADTDDETNILNCVIVQLPAGDIRTPLNLVDNAANKGKMVKVLGDLEWYFNESYAGVKNTTGYWMDGTGIVPAELTGFFIEEFTSTLGQFNQYSVTGTNTWIPNTYSGVNYAEMSGFTTAATANEDWLISNSIDCSTYSNLILRFRHTAKFVNGQWQMLKVFISSDYSGSGDPNLSGNWTEITGYTNPTGSDYVFVKSGDLDVSSFAGDATVYIAFKYSCNNVDAPKWEIDYVTLNNE